MTTIELLERTKAAWGSIRSASAEEKDRLLLAMAESLEANSEDILRENAKDMEAAKGAISDVMLDRLALTESRIHAMAEGIREAAALPDHVGRALAQFKPTAAPAPSSRRSRRALSPSAAIPTLSTSLRIQHMRARRY